MPDTPRFYQLGAQVEDFSDVAAIIDELDLVISIDTAVAHLAGSLGKISWILLSLVNDWRWQSNLNHAESLWYPSVRLFHQKTSQDWKPVFLEAYNALLNLPIFAENRPKIASRT